MMNFAAPNWAYLLFLLPLLALLKIWADARAQRAVAAFAESERLRGSLLGGASLIWSGLHFGLQLMGLGFFIIALTRPQIGVQELNMEQTGRNIFIAIDTSKSMLADDVPPSRLTRVKLAAQDLLEKLPGDRVGLIAFAGRAFLQAPLTTDHEAVIESIQSLDHTTIPRGGSSLAAAIDLALQTVAKMPGKQHGMIIFTDGQETDDAMLSLAKTAAEKRLLLLPVGVGTVEGALIPDPDPQNAGGFLRDEEGNVIKTALESAALQELASLSGGRYTELGTQTLSAEVVGRLLASLDRHRENSKQLTRPIERYQWPLFFGIMCLAMSLFMRPSSRRPVRPPPLPVDPHATMHAPVPATGATAALLLCGLLASMAPAAEIDELEQAQQHYLDGRYDAARRIYRSQVEAKDSRPPVPAQELAYGLGAATFQLKEYDRAVKSFSEALTAGDTDVQRQAQRALAAALYNQGDLQLAKQPELTVRMWTDSIDHFDSALRITPGGTTEASQILENRDFVKKRLEELKQQQEQQKQNQKQEQQGEGQGQGNPNQQPQEGQQGQEGDQKQDRGENQKTDAMQQDQGQLPEGELRAGESGQPGNETSQGQNPDDKRNDKTGFTPQEARSQLRSYADDQKSVQYLMRKEEPQGGKDY